MGERYRERQRDRERQKDTDIERKREKDSERERERKKKDRERNRESNRQSAKERQRETDTHSHNNKRGNQAIFSYEYFFHCDYVLWPSICPCTVNKQYSLPSCPSSLTHTQRCTSPLKVIPLSKNPLNKPIPYSPSHSLLSQFYLV